MVYALPISFQSSVTINYNSSNHTARPHLSKLGKNQNKYTGKYESPYDPAFCEQIMMMNREKLCTQAIMCLNLGISRQTFDQWCNPASEHFKPDFFEAAYVAATTARAKWEQEGINNLYDTGEPKEGGKGIQWSKFNEHLYLKFMERDHDFVTKQSTTNVIVDELDEESRKKLIDEYKKEY